MRSGLLTPPCLLHSLHQAAPGWRQTGAQSDRIISLGSLLQKAQGRSHHPWLSTSLGTTQTRPAAFPPGRPRHLECQG